MILISNRNYLRINNRTLLNQLNELEDKSLKENVVIEASKSKELTLKININNKYVYIHSKYDPLTEAKRIVEQQNEIDAYDHIIFIGAGLGYHIKIFNKLYPNKKISIYEPNLEILYHFLSHQELSNLNIGSIITSLDEKEMQEKLMLLINRFGKNILFFSLPVYEKLYHPQVLGIFELYKANLNNKRTNIVTNISFQKRWTINSIKNFPVLLKTPNILHDVNEKAFAGKSAIIVAAGPSLSQEFDNLKFVKENRLAYIFSVGSAINSLIERDIYPDAACTYDPTHLNQVVFQNLKEKKIDKIPLIFGSSVGYETLENYPGPMLHMITSQDTVTGNFIPNPHKIKAVLDAPSIAVVTFQLLKLLGFQQIILVGQNLAYQNNLRYADGINYQHISNEINEIEKENSILIKDVYGNDIKTNEGFNRMRAQLEMYIRESKDIEVINTTKGGAMIEGTEFTPLSKVIENRMIYSTVVPNWYNANNSYDLRYIKKQINKMKKSKDEFTHYIENVLSELKLIENYVESKYVNQLEARFVNFDSEFDKLKNNDFYKSMVLPMMRVQIDVLAEKSSGIKYEKNILEKGDRVIQAFAPFILDCKAHYEFASEHFEIMKQEVDNFIEDCIE
ncbi:motility associated factor glycosyltransferase family protein [Lederbergia graminis]|uniref:Motility associated factor glycosyltransferase family protein n=1 Tax=Lederbergia graminis TaxID=735518 RepID=A0ABW0LK52_9BACI